MGIVDEKQFFRDLYASIEANCSAEQLQQFGQLVDDESRFRYLHDLQGIDKFAELRRHDDASESAAEAHGKNRDEALELKRAGNVAFQEQRYEEAARLYGRGQLLMPATENEGAEVAILLANRSAALYHQELYDQAMADIDLALPAYPKRLRYKLAERKARCFLARNEFEPALRWFK